MLQTEGKRTKNYGKKRKNNRSNDTEQTLKNLKTVLKRRANKGELLGFN